mmetsp:Transcript_11634/g.34199  ORF Transcript_11634/g.34199 Transcript_11634/m.34199 type:complete len:341 (-) Transcript_11634:34-1056(-)
MISDHGLAAEEAGVALLPFAGYDCVPAELWMQLVGRALEEYGALSGPGDDGEDSGVMGELNLAFFGEGGGFPRGTLETMLDGFDGKTPKRKEGDARFYPKEYRTAVKSALSPISLIIPKWSSHVGRFTGRNLMAGINIPVLCRSAPILGFSSDLAILDRSVMSDRPSMLNTFGLIPTQLYIVTLLLSGLTLVMPPIRWWLRRKLQTYSFGGNASGKVVLDAEGLSKGVDRANVTAHIVVPGDPGIYANGLFAAGVANALVEATSVDSKVLPPLVGIHSPVAALHNSGNGLLVKNLMKLGAKISVQVTPSKGAEAMVLDAVMLGQMELKKGAETKLPVASS